MRLYVSGAVTGMPDNNRKAFERAAVELENIGYDVLVPHWFVPPAITWENAMKHAICTMFHCDAVARLPGSEASRGSKTECCLAYDLKMPVLEIGDWMERPIR